MTTSITQELVVENSNIYFIVCWTPRQNIRWVVHDENFLHLQINKITISNGLVDKLLLCYSIYAIVLETYKVFSIPVTVKFDTAMEWLVFFRNISFF